MKHSELEPGIPTITSPLISHLISRFQTRLQATLHATPLIPLWLTAFLAGVLSACSPAPEAGLYTHDAYIKSVIPGRTMTAAYASFTNHDPEELCLTQFSGAIARSIELHITESTGGPNSGRVAMREIHQLCIAPGETATLEPGGMHLMVMGLSELPRPPENISLLIGTADGRAFEVAFSVRPFNQ